MKKFMIQPNIKQFVGEILDETTVLDYISEDGNIEQHLKDLVLTTKQASKEETYMGIVTKTQPTEWTSTFRKGDRIIFSNEEGYVISPYKMVTVKEAIEELNYIKEV